MKQTMVEFLRGEMKHLNGMIYFNKPYSCCEAEAFSYFRGFDAPDPKRTEINREDKQITITIKPIPGNRVRKPFVIKMWVS